MPNPGNHIRNECPHVALPALDIARELTEYINRTRRGPYDSEDVTELTERGFRNVLEFGTSGLIEAGHAFEKRKFSAARIEHDVGTAPKRSSHRSFYSSAW